MNEKYKVEFTKTEIELLTRCVRSSLMMLDIAAGYGPDSRDVKFERLQLIHKLEDAKEGKNENL